METHYYYVTTDWDSGRKGTITSPELERIGPNPITVATPPEFPEGIPGIWSPEHLLVSAASSCLMTTFLAIASNSKLEFNAFRCESSGKLEQTDEGIWLTEILLKPVIELKSEKDQERALRIIQKAEAACLISKSIRSKIILEPKILIAAV